MPYPSKSDSFVFEAWAELAQRDPQAFEQQRQHYIDALIAEMPSAHRRRMECLQWRIDMERNRAATPLSACVRISRMMMDSVYGKEGLVDAIKGKVSYEVAAPLNVVAFTRRVKQGQEK